MDWLSGIRCEFLLPHLAPATAALEIGAFARPTLRGHPFNANYVDFYSTEELKAQAKLAGVDPADVVDVDYVVRGEDYRDAIPDRFDLVIANHVLEHIANPIKWINMAAELLHENGLLFISLPDKRRSFDQFRANTQLSHVVADFLQNEVVTNPEHVIETIMYYDVNYIGKKRDLKASLDVERMKQEMFSPHPGIHTHVFDGTTFLSKILKPLIYMRLIPFALVDYRPETPAGEFYFLLRKGWQPVELTEEEFFGAPDKLKDAAMRESISSPASANSGPRD